MLDQMTLPNSEAIKEYLQIPSSLDTESFPITSFRFVELVDTVADLYRTQYEKLVISTNVLPNRDITNETVLIKKEIPRILTTMQAYELALNALRTFEDEWDNYTQEEARFLSAFDEDDE